MDEHWEDTEKHVSNILWVIDGRNFNLTTITTWVLSLRRLWVMRCWGPIGNGIEFPLSRIGKDKILRVSGVDGLPGE
ncbi:hypothetical protein BD309DRAFT_870786 [Dichomitus squalens]|uniref:Uncharacterized protein n=1 Tax=Dichomitus squalens TaxID=114155 RepID=A0A4Q9MTA3_9APHY|nr:hypothetical protein BD311DRAFT_657477 [Dichomitus squalens]TBU40178.1 hypothetical protein BD309DRAFT_870786 [Dichomitus squalens]TBU52925.1 hypothetical protein BD310DRAFT_831183 [Dichomitus squalens]